MEEEWAPRNLLKSAVQTMAGDCQGRQSVVLNV